MMKSIFLFCVLLIAGANGFAQAKIPSLDKSPMDMSFYPTNYPVLKIQDKVTDPLAARIIYSRPQKNNRPIFGELIEYGKVWRLGANEATEIEFYQQVKVNDVKIKKGRYTLYAIPYADKWTFIINKDLETWGAFKYDEKKDVVRIDVPVEKTDSVADAFTMVFDKTASGFSLNAYWDNIKVSLPISYP